MLDPAIAALLEHLNWSPPAIVQTAPVEATDPMMAAYADYIAQQETQLSSWIERGCNLRNELWKAASSPTSNINADRLTRLISQFEEGLKREAGVLARKEKEARRGEKGLRGAERAFVTRQHDRLLKVGRTFYEEGRDFAAFLRALRAELDPESHKGVKFESPDALERHLLKSTA